MVWVGLIGRSTTIPQLAITFVGDPVTRKRRPTKRTNAIRNLRSNIGIAQQSETARIAARRM
jgi:hypothetical protein